ncbi:MAG: Crp/Fnr family transcriptional regulator [Bacteroidetes bacterium]|nr:Crp/Fnr family transcriptional regulator [Bacteroidota bacterium]
MKEQEKIKSALDGFRLNAVLDLEELSDDDRQYIRERSTTIRVRRKQIIYSMHEKPKGMYLVRSGKIRIEQVNYDGSAQILFIYTTGEAFGYRPLLSRELHPVNAIAMEDSELDFISASDFLELLHRSVALSNMLLTSLSSEFTVLVNRINLFAQRGIKERLAFALLLLNEKYHHPNAILPESDIRLSRIDLANYIGTSPETLVRTLRTFQEKNLIRVKGRSITILNFESLLILSGIMR